MLSGMNTPETGSPSDSGSFADAVTVWYLVRCSRCVEDLAEPFRDEVERDAWAAEHTTATGHAVRLTTADLEEFPDLHMTGIITRDQAGTYRYVCPAEDCGRSCGPYASAGLAIASWRSHAAPTPAAIQ